MPNRPFFRWAIKSPKSAPSVASQIDNRTPLRAIDVAASLMLVPSLRWFLSVHSDHVPESLRISSADVLMAPRETCCVAIAAAAILQLYGPQADPVNCFSNAAR